MAITKTTLSGAVAILDTTIGVASATGITAPVVTTGVGQTYLYIGSEMMGVVGVVGTQISVTRGINGTRATTHGASEAVVIGGPADFVNFTPAQAVFTQANDRFAGFAAPVASATTIIASGTRFHVTGTTATATITPPENFVEGRITIVADGVWTWTAAGNIAVAGTVTTAASSVDFIYDAGTTKWYPTRLA